MREISVEIIRKFAPLMSRSGHWDALYLAPGKPQGWHEIEHERRVLILADVGAGKTFEALARARKLRQRERKSFFIRIEAIDPAFEMAFEVGSKEEFESWLISDEEAWFFLDSVDEAQLETPRAFEAAIRIFGERIHTARERAHIFLTSRDEAWQALPDRTLVEQYLPWGEPDKSKNSERNSGEPNPPMLKVFRLTDLSQDNIRLFASYYGVDDVAEFMVAIQRANLMGLAARPFDLKALIQKWLADHALGGRFDVLQRMIELQLQSLSHSHKAGGTAMTRVRSGARLLAGAVTLTGKTIICLPDGVHSPDRINPSELLSGWSAAEIDRLLRTGIFDDVVYSSVRFRHREIRELLCAEWAKEMLAYPGGRTRVENLFFREIYGEWVIVPRVRPVLTWLILLDVGVRDRALAIAPELASEGGDASRLPLDVRRAMLAEIVERIAKGTE